MTKAEKAPTKKKKKPAKRKPAKKKETKEAKATDIAPSSGRGIEFHRSQRQKAFMTSKAFETLYGGAAGGGKSYGQLLDAMFFALQYPGSKQLILRRTFADLDKSLIRVSLDMYPRELYTYNAGSHVGRWKNGSIIDFGYCANEGDVYQYQSAEYDVIRFDELTHFTEFQYVYLISRCRGANDFPKAIKSSTNPGGVGHTWCKARFIDPAPPDTMWTAENGTTRIFIPAKLDDNKFLLRSDPAYKDRLMALPEAQQKALLQGCWDIFEGQYFPEWDADKHVCRPFPIPAEWRRFRAFDYGLDRFACLWCAVSSDRHVYVYREYCESNLPISAAAGEAISRTPAGEDVYCTWAPPDMFGRGQESGQAKSDIFAANGLRLTKSSNNREAGWLAIKELLKLDANGEAHLHVFENCRELIRCLPMHQYDPDKPTDCLTEPHEITHVVDALRYFAVSWSRPAPEQDTTPRTKWTADMMADYYRASAEERQYLINKYGKPEGIA